MKILKEIVLVTILFLLTIVETANAQTPIDIKDNELVKPKSITIDRSLDKSTADQIIHTAQLFYTFWNTGDQKYLNAGVSPNFIDNTLPAGRPQGPEGLKFASNNFRKAVPDLHCTLEDLLVVGDKVTARLLFTGTFKGKFKEHPPTNKPVKFFAIDILQIKDGKLIQDWHLEDNLTLLQQLGAIKML